mgnify:CR=1 FL=1
MVLFYATNGWAIDIDIDGQSDARPDGFRMDAVSVIDDDYRQVEVPSGGLNGFCVVEYQDTTHEYSVSVDRRSVMNAWRRSGSPAYWNPLGPAPNVYGWNI